MLFTKLSLAAVAAAALFAAAACGDGGTTEMSTATTSPGVTVTAEPDLVAIRRAAIEKAYPQFKDFESQKSFAGQSVKVEVDDGDYYFAYMVLGSGLPIAQATCFRVDRLGRAFEVGLFPDPLDSYAGYRDVNPRNCRGIK